MKKFTIVFGIVVIIGGILLIWQTGLFGKEDKKKDDEIVNGLPSYASSLEDIVEAMNEYHHMIVPEEFSLMLDEDYVSIQSKIDGDSDMKVRSHSYEKDSDDFKASYSEIEDYTYGDYEGVLAIHDFGGYNFFEMDDSKEHQLNIRHDEIEDKDEFIAFLDSVELNDETYDLDSLEELMDFDFSEVKLLDREAYDYDEYVMEVETAKYSTHLTVMYNYSKEVSDISLTVYDGEMMRAFGDETFESETGFTIYESSDKTFEWDDGDYMYSLRVQDHDDVMNKEERREFVNAVTETIYK